MTGLARFAINAVTNTAHTAATQWFERTLDDSANRRIVLAETFLAADAILCLYQDISERMVVYPKVIAAHLAAELPFMASEEILMAAVKAGGHRQELHEKIRRHAMAAARRVKVEGKSNDFLERIEKDPAFSAVDVRRLTRSENFIGRSPEQVEEFLKEIANPLLGRFRGRRGARAELRV
jgi:adenylosuccinate lyase